MGSEAEMMLTERCPVCGHELSEHVRGRGGERSATTIASRVASWWFAGTLLTFVAVWIVANVVAQPFEPYPVIIFAVISAVLATIAALQGPLILLTQRRATERDRARAREEFMVAVNAESDIHRLERKLDDLAAALGDRSG